MNIGDSITINGKEYRIVGIDKSKKHPDPNQPKWEVVLITEEGEELRLSQDQCKK